MNTDRRTFIQKTGLATAAVTLGGMATGLSAKSYARVSGSGERVRIAIIGVNGRGTSMAGTFAKQANASVEWICDVDERVLGKAVKVVEKASGTTPKTVRDFRTLLSDPSLDAVYIAMPDHWHTPAAIMCLAAGKHVYVEKPVSHNPREGELLVQAVEKYNKVLQTGSQRRSWPTLIKGLEELQAGVIGRVYMAKGWYVNNRPSIGIGKKVAIPSELDYELWQGPAPRQIYRDNLIHYNWHWFWNWGTGEALNNGTHEMDVMRLGLGLDYPLTVHSVGGRFRYKDDWETPDTQLITFDAPGDVLVAWEGKSCNGRLEDGRSRGVIFYGDSGAMHTGDNSYTIYDINNKLVKDVKSDIVITDGQNTMSPGEELDALHVKNFLDSIRTGSKPSASALDGHKSTVWMHLGNIAHRTGRKLNINVTNGHILDDKEAIKLWGRTYEKGWEIKI
ncbi:MAG: Gfo/Idh/MocA family oxidoreductase [Bacteroidales bacterium]